MRLLAWVAIACLMGCSVAGPVLDGPTNDELTRSVRDAGLSNIILDTGLNKCSDGQIDYKGVKVCNFCIVSVELRRNEKTFQQGAFLQVERDTWSVAFKRAFSAEQPDIEPSAGQRGVWIAIRETFKKITSDMIAPLAAEQMQRAGYVRRTGMESFLEAGASGPPDEVKTKLESDEALRRDVTALVGSCSAPQGASPQRTASVSPQPTTALPAEEAAPPDFSDRLTYSIVELTPQPFVYAPGVAAQDAVSIEKYVDLALKIVRQNIELKKLQTYGPPIAVEKSWNDNKYEFYAGWRLKNPAPGGTVGVLYGTSPGGTAVKVEYKGDPSKLLATYDKIEALILAAKLPLGKSFEVYNDDPGVSGEVDREIYYLVQGEPGDVHLALAIARSEESSPTASAARP